MSANIKTSSPYFSNALGFIAFMAVLAIGVKSCCSVEIEREKTKQIELQTQTKK